MNYTFTQRSKIIALSLMTIGVIGVVTGFMTNSDHTRAWASLLHNNFFFMGMGLAGIAFVAIQYVAEVGWSAQIKRIPLAMSTYIPFAAIAMLLIFIFGHHDLYSWTHEGVMVEGSENYDEKLANKSGFLNIPFFVIRMVIYFTIWCTFAFLIRRNAIAEDTLGGTTNYFKNRKLSAAFLVLFLISSSMMAWDFIMSIDPHWFSTLFGWYTFASLWVTGLSMMALLLVYLKKQGLLPGVAESHLHDVGKFMFGFSIFWTYLWFAQFMLIWFANLPEESAYFIPRLDKFRWVFWLNFFLNFITPFLVLMTRDAKRKFNVLAVGTVIIMIGHWIDMYLMIMPGTAGSSAGLGISEISSLFLFGGLFMYVVLRNLAAAPLVAPNHPMLQESINHTI